MDCTPTQLAIIVKKWISRGHAPARHIGLDMIAMCDSVIEQGKPSTPYDPTAVEPRPITYHYLAMALEVCAATARENGSGSASWHPDGPPMKRLAKIQATAEKAIRDYNRQVCQKEENEQ